MSKSPHYRAGRVRVVEVEEMFTRKLNKNQAFLETLAPYLDNPSKEAIFERNQIKEQHETTKFQDEEVMLNST